MKNLTRITFIILAILVFFSIYQNNKTDFGRSITADMTEFSVQSDISVNDTSEKVASDATLRGYDILVEDVEYIDNEYWIVYYTTCNTDDFLSFETSKGNCHIGTDEYISNAQYIGDGQKYELYTTTESKVVILPFDKFIERNKDITAFVIYCKTADKDNVFSSLKESGFEITDYNDLSYVKAGDTSLVVIPSLIFLLSIMLYTIHSAKKYTLMRMDGFSIGDIITNEVFSQMPVYIVSIATGILISAVYVKVGLKRSLIEYLGNGVDVIKIFFIVLVISVLIRFVFAMVFCKDKYIKGAVHGNIMYFAISVVKVISLFYLILLLSNVIAVNVIPAVNEYKTLLKCSEKYKGRVFFTQFKGGFEQSDLSENKLKPQFVDFYLDSENNCDAIVCDTYNYQTDEDGRPLYLDNANIGYGPEIRVNGNYLNENEIFDMEGRRIDSGYLNSDCLNILIPDDYKWSKDNVYGPELNEIPDGFEYRFITYDSENSKLYAYLPNVVAGYPNGLIYPSPAIIVVNEYALKDLNIRYSVLLDVLYGRVMYRVNTDNPEAELSPLFRKYNCSDIVDGIESLEDSMRGRIEAAKKELIQSVISLSLCVCILIMVSVFTVSYYCRNNRRLIAMRALDGFSFTGIFKMHTAVVAVEYILLALSICFISRGRTMTYVPYAVGATVMFFDLAVNAIRCRIQMMKDIYKISKGEM